MTTAKIFKKAYSGSIDDGFDRIVDSAHVRRERHKTRTPEDQAKLVSKLDADIALVNIKVRRRPLIAERATCHFGPRLAEAVETSSGETYAIGQVEVEKGVQ